MSEVNSIDKLRGLSNYGTWMLDMKACLNRAHLWKVICGAELPNSVVAQHPADVLAEVQQPAGIPDPQYHERNEAAYDAIILGVENPQKQLISDCKNNGKAAWEKLARLYNHPGRLNLKRQLYLQTTQRADEPVQSYILRKMELLSRLQEIGCAMTDIEAADAILMGLRGDWESWVEQLAERGGYSLAEVERSLIAEEARRRAAGLLPATNGDTPAFTTSPTAPVAATPAKRLSGDFAGGPVSTPAKRPRTTSTPRCGSARKPRLQQSLNNSAPSSPATNGHPSTPTANNATRPFQCLFSFSGCRQLFGSKNEWKRHINHIHLQLWYWRCDFPSCANRKGLFNRKDLFGQHLKRMHADEPSTPAIQDRCRKQRRSPPTNNKCGFCGRKFEGTGSWDACVDHVGEHYANGKGETWELDDGFVEWAVREGVVVRNEDGTFTNAAPIGSAGGREEEVKEETRVAPPAPMGQTVGQQMQQQQEVQ